MLLVVSIIVLLISMLLPALSASRCQAQVVQCLSQFESIGAGLNMHVLDNQKKLPGPSWYGQEPRYNTGSKTLARWLAPYMGFKPATSAYQVNTLFICPAFEAVKPNFATETCVIMGALSATNKSNGLRVFGYPAFNSEPEYGPSSIGSVKFPGQTQAVKDIDQYNNPTAGWVDKTSRQPNHCWTGTSEALRNYVYFDGHAKTIKEFLGSLPAGN